MHATSPCRCDRGFSIVEVLMVMALIGIMAMMTVPQLLQAFERSRQRRTLADMRSIAGANAVYRVDSRQYAAALPDLEPQYLSTVPFGDAWGNGWAYSGGVGYTLTSYGEDGAAGPAPPSPWFDQPFEADLIIQDGVFTQAPDSNR